METVAVTDRAHGNLTNEIGDSVSTLHSRPSIAAASMDGQPYLIAVVDSTDRGF